MSANKMLTHHDTIDLGQIGELVFVESVLGESDCRMNGWIKVLLVEHACREDFIDVIHGWDNHGKVGGSTREE